MSQSKAYDNRTIEAVVAILDRCREEYDRERKKFGWDDPFFKHKYQLKTATVDRIYREIMELTYEEN